MLSNPLLKKKLMHTYGITCQEHSLCFIQSLLKKKTKVHLWHYMLYCAIQIQSLLKKKTHVYLWHYMLYKKSSVKKQAHINQLQDSSHEKAKKMTTVQQPHVSGTAVYLTSSSIKIAPVCLIRSSGCFSSWDVSYR